MPGVPQVIAISVRHSDQGLDGVDVLLLHLCDAGAGCQQGEPGQSLNVRIPLQLLRNTKKVTKTLFVFQGSTFLIFMPVFFSLHIMVI